VSRPSLREKLLQAGFEVIYSRGYLGTGVRDIAAAADAPLGSFTNHFRSKEDFAIEVLDLFFDGTRQLVNQAMQDTSLTPRQRLRRYLDIITERLESRGFTCGCMIGDFSLEAAPHSEKFRARLSAIFAEWRQPFAACIAEGQATGEINTAFTPEDLAEFLLASWEGAILRMKVERSAVPLERFKAIAFATVFTN
jgi:TetR/AcrR family transcriptional repressor of nem operon